jgi:hypothetical protein
MAIAKNVIRVIVKFEGFSAVTFGGWKEFPTVPSLPFKILGRYPWGTL